MHQSLPSPNLHRHAWSQHQRGQGQSLPIADGQTTLVSTGTGSGKTECFLYPVVSQCLKLRDEKAPPGISAVIVYPMNALAEDQLMRLRGLLAGTGIPFGIYVGKTPERDVDVVGVRLRAGSSRADYEARLDRARRDGSGETVYPAEEVCSREIMRTARRQARILLTNVKQLELLLTRQQDIELFTDDPQAARKFAARFFGVASETVTPVGEDYEAEIWAEPRSVAPEPSEYPAEILERCVGAVQDDDPAGPHVRAAYRSLSGVDLDRDAWPAALHEALSRSEIVFALNEELAAPRALDELPVALQRRIGRPRNGSRDSRVADARRRRSRACWVLVAASGRDAWRYASCSGGPPDRLKRRPRGPGGPSARGPAALLPPLRRRAPENSFSMPVLW